MGIRAVAACPPGARSILTVEVAYGIVAQRRANAQLWKTVLRYTARLGNSPQIICADFNSRLSDESDLPREIFTALRRGLLVDIMRVRAEAGGCQPSPTYQGSSGTETRIDDMLTNPRVASLVQDERVIKKPGLPGHSLLRVDISLDMANRKVTKIRSLEDPEEHNMHTEERQRLAAVFWDSVSKPWKAAICEEDVNGMWNTWTWAAEEFLLMERGEDNTVESTLRRHWLGPPVAKTNLRELDQRGRGTQLYWRATRPKDGSVAIHAQPGDLVKMVKPCKSHAGHRTRRCGHIIPAGHGDAAGSAPGG